MDFYIMVNVYKIISLFLYSFVCWVINNLLNGVMIYLWMWKVEFYYYCYSLCFW